MLPPSTRFGSVAGAGSSQYRTSADPDEAVRSTDDDAAASRLSAVNLGYLDDPFVSNLYRPKYGESSRKTPLINVGTHHRTYAIDLLVDQFLEQGGGQIVSLGAGSDTRFWRLMSRTDTLTINRYIEIDFPHMTSLKAQRIARSPQLCNLLSSSPHRTGEKPYTISKGGTQLSSPIYTLLPLDLRQSPSTALSAELLPLLDPKVPTLFLAECVLCYLQPAVGEEIIRWFSDHFESCMGVVYEMCGLDGTFGQVMKRNLAARQLSLPGATFQNPKAQSERFLRPKDKGQGTEYDQSGGKTLWEIREHVIDQEELRRISKLEHLDEIEELRLVLSHYCVVWGIKGKLALAGSGSGPGIAP